MQENLIQLIWKCISGFFFLPIWYGQKIFSRNPRLWVFGAWRGQNYSDNTKALFEYTLLHRKDVSAVWITYNPTIYKRLKSEGKPVEMATSLSGIKACLKAGIVFLSCGVTELNQKYINGAKQIWLWHGMPMKKIEADIPKTITTFKRLKTIIRRVFLPYEFNNRYDFLLTTSAFFDPMFASAFRSDKSKIYTIGYPRNDVFFDKQHAVLIEEIDSRFNHPLKIMYMPTFRDAQKDFNPFASFGFSVSAFNELLNTQNIVFFYKGHFYGDTEANDLNSVGNRFIHVKDDSAYDTYQLLKDIDVLITDYSSIYFDFLLMKKPVILTPFDVDDYIKYSRPLYFDYFQHIEGIKAMNWNEVFDIIATKRYYEPSDEAIDKFHKFRDGNSSRRVVDCVIDKYL